MMKKHNINYVALFLSLFLLGCWTDVSATQVRILPDNRIVSSGVLAPGEYEIRAVSGGWNAWGGDATPPSTGWQTDYFILSETNRIIGGHGTTPAASPSAAIASTSSVFLAVPEAQSIGFRTTDDFRFLDDNVGSLTISVLPTTSNPDPRDILFGSDDSSNFAKLLRTVEAYGGEARELVKSWLETGDLAGFFTKLGSRIETNLSRALSRIGGPLLNLVSAPLTDATSEFVNGVEALHRTARDGDANPSWNRNTNRQLHRFFREEQERYGGERTPVQPNSMGENSAANFETEVPGGSPVVFDPDLAPGFVYESHEGPLFASFVLPFLGENQGKYIVQIFSDNEWIDFVNADPLVEYFFDIPIQKFRVLGISDSYVGRFQWLSALSFAEEGVFIGSITPTAVPIPPAIFGVIAPVVILIRLSWKRAVRCKMRQLSA